MRIGTHVERQVCTVFEVSRDPIRSKVQLRACRSLREVKAPAITIIRQIVIRQSGSGDTRTSNEAEGVTVDIFDNTQCEVACEFRSIKIYKIIALNPRIINVLIICIENDITATRDDQVSGVIHLKGVGTSCDRQNTSTGMIDDQRVDINIGCIQRFDRDGRSTTCRQGCRYTCFFIAIEEDSPRDFQGVIGNQINIQKIVVIKIARSTRRERCDVTIDDVCRRGFIIRIHLTFITFRNIGEGLEEIADPIFFFVGLCTEHDISRDDRAAQTRDGHRTYFVAIVEIVKGKRSIGTQQVIYCCASLNNDHTVCFIEHAQLFRVVVDDQRCRARKIIEDELDVRAADKRVQCM